MVEITDYDISDDVRRLNPEAFPPQGEATGKKPSKYRNKWTSAAGMRFQSGREAVRAGELLLLLRAKEIFNLGFQVDFPLPGGGIYRADFVYLDKQLQVVVEDAKSEGTKTPVYKLKKKQFENFYGIKIKEV